MNLALQIGNSQIPCDRVLQQLYDAQLLPQLLREIVIDELIDRVAGDHQIDLSPTPEEFDRLSAQVAEITPFQGMNEAQIEAITLRTLKLHKFKQAGWGQKVSGYYQSVQHQLYRVSYSILQVEDGLIAQEVFFRIQSGEQSFAELAVQYSQDPSAKKGGLVGPMLSRDLPPAIAQVLQQLSPGQLSPLFQIERNYGFIRLNELTPPQLDENIHQVLLDELFESWIQAQIATEVGNGDISIQTEPADTPTAIAETVPVITPAEPVPIDGNGNGKLPTHPIADIFAPDFGYREIDLTQTAVVEPVQSTDTPEVTVVTEPDDAELDVSSGFFFADRQKDRSLANSNLIAGATAPLPHHVENGSDRAFVIPPDPASTTSPIVQAQNRSRLLVVTLGITVAIAICTNQYISRYGNPYRLLPESVRGWVEGTGK
jgi:parvulin-like peptidyl-prolyl isomerase